MNLDLIDRIIKFTLLTAFLLSLCIGYSLSVSFGFGFIVGAIWSCINFLTIKWLLNCLLIAENRSFIKISGFLFLKFPLLYFTGYYILTLNQFPILSIVLGISLILAVTFAFTLKSAMAQCALIALFLLSASSSYASIAGDVPEVPNLITLIYRSFQTPFTQFLHHWENILFSIFVAIVISIVFYLAASKKAWIPTGIQNFVECIIDYMRRFIVSILGQEGEKYVPFLGTLFIYILSMNLLTVIPFFKPPTSSVNITAAFAIVVFIYVQYLNIKNWGFFGFLYHMAGSPKDLMGWIMVPLMLPIEILTQLTRPLTLALRLFGNIAGEDILIGAASLFGVYLLSSINLQGGLPMQIPFIFLALLTGLMQALVFTLLTTIYILLSIPSAEEKASH